MSQQQEAQPEQQATQERHVHFFHTHEQGMTPRRYSAGGYVTEKDGEQLLVLAYAVQGEGESVFDKHKARTIIQGRLEKNVKTYPVTITQDEYEHPARTLMQFASTHAPLTAFDKHFQRVALSDIKEQQEAKNEEYPKTAWAVLLPFPGSKEYQEMEAQLQQQQEASTTAVQSSIVLGGLLNQEQAQA